MLKALTTLLVIAVLAVVALGGYAWWFVHTPIGTRAEKVSFAIAPGSNLRSAAKQMKASGIYLPAIPFEVLARALGKTQDVKAGQYELVRGATPLDLLDKITRGDFAMSEVRFIEGWTFRQLRDALDAHPDLLHETAGMAPGEIMKRLGMPDAHPEGWFFPDTYRFAKGTSDLEVLRQANVAMKKNLAAAWARRAPDLPLKSDYEALILASLVEKETGRPEDRARVAGVFVNRLREGMRLQTDPAVIYGLGEKFDGNLRRRDLEADTRYNTYTRDGLPPTPIALPGMSALQAATVPERTDALYFVSRGDGTSEFSRSLSDHNRAVRKYQLGGK